MPTCKLCAKSGWFLKVSKDSLCDLCNLEYVSTISRSSEIIQDSIKIIQNSKNPMTRLSRINVAIDNCKRMMGYHQAGVSTITPSPPELIDALDKARQEVVTDFIQAELLKVRARSSAARTRASKLSPYPQLLAKLAAFYSELEDVSIVDLWDLSIRREMTTVEVKAGIEEAEKLEHRGQQTKALTLYRDALFVLERSELPDEQKAEMSVIIKARLGEAEEKSNRRLP